ncbi:Wzz/FepE/Etk N-terminal domain-containing protein [Methylotenera sp.]|uniref:Wzz/FepE/Etk N-terminal domain-containing protein n=1 Tax=Methylotenera sp. TaxID=2051956 RepID=UPI0027302DF7|nr:Wzz/FepE/Etk N-terminal domain-containing protein [Methylotenera sp.]MDP2230701.1 Wzz/FepE/Etk N-terminal domain-containing protein [Methylotenera sp.]MDP3140817.1 Wzz/FepE/Etk N-terminal domain-containing protein [Methylotenera sp.]
MNKSKSALSVTHEDQFDDELSLLDLVAFMQRNFYVLLGGALLGAVLGVVIAFVLPAQWEASALVRVGQLGNVGNVGNVGSPIEPPLQLVDRIKNKSFQNDVLTRLGLKNGDYDVKAKLFRDTLKVKLEKSELISLTLKGTSSNEVKQQMNAVIIELKSIHAKMSAPSISRWQQELASTELELKRASEETERLAKSLNESNSLNERVFSQAALVSNLLIARESELRSLRERKRMLEEQLSPERTFATSELGRVEVSEKPVFPKKPLFGLAGLFLGLLSALLWCALKSMIVRKSVTI